MAHFKVLSTLKFNGDVHAVGAWIEGEATAFADLVADGVLKAFGDVPLEAAQAQDAADAAEAERIAREAQPAAGYGPEGQDTWAPTPEEPVTAAGADDAEKKEDADATAAAAGTDQPTLAKFEVMKAFEVTNPESKNFGVHEVGAIIEADPVAAAPLVEAGTLAPVADETGDDL